jgi:YD repeat-containing protein
MKFVSLLCILFISQAASAFVDLKNSNFADSWIDYRSQGTGYQLRVQRTYNSRSTYDGLFGFGWCSDFETRVEITPSNSLKVIECGGGMEITYVSGKPLKGKELSDHIEKIISMSKQVNPRLQKDYIKRLRKDLEDNQYLREELAKKLGIKGKVENKSVYFARGRGGERIEFVEDFYKRTLSDGTYQKFDSKGRLLSFYDRNSNYLNLTYSKDKLIQVVDNNGRRLGFSYAENDKVSQITAPGGKKIRYTYRGHDLIQVNNAWKMAYNYSYDKLHNLIEITYPDKSFKKITYNPDKDLVLSLQDRNKCIENYEYQGSKDDPRNHYWSSITKTCNGKVTNRSKYEFWHRKKRDGTGKFLYRVYSNVNGKEVDVKYHDIFGKPTSVKEGRKQTWYSYNALGLIKIKKTPLDRISFDYDTDCKKVSKILREEFRDMKKPDRVTSSEAARYVYYKPKCNLKYALNSNGTKVKVGYDTYGRINKLIDQTQKYVSLTYDEKFGKPSIIKRPGLGAIKIIYDEQGQMTDFKSSQSDEVATQIATVFNHLLEIVAPVAEGLSI